MAYKIEPKTVKEFIDMDTALPRFQRKQTWKPKDNFKLCISVFKDYPIGVVIINNSGKNWVLDGRQRLNALSKINKNPSEVYNWAQKFIGFKNADGSDVVTKMYWNKIDDYLQKDFEEDVYDEKGYNKKKKNSSDGDLVEEAEDSEEIDSQVDMDENETSSLDKQNEHSYNSVEQKNSLNILLNYILMVHNYKSGKSKFERIYDFSKIIKKLDYYQVIEGKTSFVERNLMKMINDIISKSKENGNKDLITEDDFINYFISVRYIDEDDSKTLNDFRKQVQMNWNDIKTSFEIIDKVNGVLSNSRIGIIEITQASNLDAQNMFSLVNTGGTLLTAEEILSAKPFWNKVVLSPSKECKVAVDALYKTLKVEQPDNVVRWDLCATLMSRIDKAGVIFEKHDTKSFAEQTTLGFKLVSSILLGGISSAVVSELEKETTFNWDTDYESLITDLNNLIDVITQHNYFSTMKTWKQSIMGITSNTIALEFITIMYKRWIAIGKRTVDSAETTKLRKDAVVLLDRLIYEYSTKMWRGSSDSKLASDIKDENIPGRLAEVSYSSWKAILDSMKDGKINDQTCTLNLVKPILYHSKFLNLEPSSVPSVKYDLDHIYPQKLFKANSSYQDIKDSIYNLEILSKSANESKNDKQLIAVIGDVAITDEIVKSSYIGKSDFNKYSDINNIKSLIDYRYEIIKTIFETKRSSTFNN